MEAFLEGRLPLVAILRGLEPDRAADVGELLVDCGFDILEVPLNSPEPMQSIARLVAAVGDRALVGAGTVLTEREVDHLHSIGAGLVVSPNCDTRVIARSASLGLVTLPGVLTPTEMFAALDAGASGLKIFPAEMVAPAVIRAVRAVLPPTTAIFAVGGIEAANMQAFLAAGAVGFGIGGALFRPGKPLDAVAADARALVEAYRAARSAASTG